jgi:hypothetical protein
MSYPTSGFVPNKHVILKTDFEGNMSKVFSYNNGGSHYPYITKPKDNIGVLLSGFTTNYSPVSFKPILIRTDDALESGCNQTDRLSQTVMEYPDFQVREPSYEISSGGSFINSSVSEELIWADSMICSNIVNPCTTSNMWALESDNRTGYLSFDPSSQTIQLFEFNEEIMQIQLFDNSGKLVAQQKGNINLMVPSSFSGIGMVRIEFANESRSFKVPIIR